MTQAPSRPTLRESFLRGERRLEVFFYTSNLAKYLQAATVFSRSGLTLKHFKSTTEPYSEDYTLGKERLLTKAVAEILGMLGKQSLFFVEDTSLRIEGLCTGVDDVPGLAVKEWFVATSFERLDAALKDRGKNRSATIKSDIALHVPGLPRPLFFHGEISGSVATSFPDFAENTQYPWLTPHTFNGWFIPTSSDKRLGEMALEESWQYDFRIRALEELLSRLDEYAAILNLPPHAYSRRRSLGQTNQLYLFPELKPVLVVVGKTCAGKTTLGERLSQVHGMKWVEASHVLRTFRTDYDDSQCSDFEFAQKTLQEMGADIVARKILQLYCDDVQNGLVITGFRTIEELETLKARVPHAQIVVINASERSRFQRYLARGRRIGCTTIREFRAHDQRQWTFGLLRVSEEFADIRIVNEGSLSDFYVQIDALAISDGASAVAGVSHIVRPRHGLANNQLYRCLLALDEAGRSLSCDEIQSSTARSGDSIRHNNANKVLKRVPEFARRFDVDGERVRYEVTNAGRAYVRYMKVRFEREMQPFSNSAEDSTMRRT
jgi:inosine/xanthosine triphosphate pyrophosphatase family protein/dephospho-CoA kinase